MGTRSLICFYDEAGNVICVLYTQCDGYVSGNGKKLINYLKYKLMVNGISGNQPCFNGMGDLALRCIAHLKFFDHQSAHDGTVNYANHMDPGYFYLHSYDKDVPIEVQASDCWAEYVYKVTFSEEKPSWAQDSERAVGRINVKIEIPISESWKTIFDGEPESFEVEKVEDVQEATYEEAEREGKKDDSASSSAQKEDSAASSSAQSSAPSAPASTRTRAAKSQGPASSTAVTGSICKDSDMPSSDAASGSKRRLATKQTGSHKTRKTKS
jgi:hypothetical protein